MAFDLTLDASEAAVAEVFGRFFANESTPAVVRGAEPLGFSVDLWRRASELGLAGMGAAEPVGGGGASWRDLVLVAEAVGQTLAPIPFADHTVVAHALGEARLASGEAIAALAVRPAVDGVWRLVPAGAIADVVVGVDGRDLVAVWSPRPGASGHNHGSAPLADRDVTGDRVRLGDASEFDGLLSRWKLLVAAALGGLAQRALEIAVSYVKERHQFGRPIGSFQALQHGLADCVAPVEAMRMLARKAAWALDTGGVERDVDEGEITDASVLASMAFAFATEGAAAVTKRAMQCHGSYGFSQEYDIQLYYRRARGWPLALHGAVAERTSLADELWPVAVA